MLTLFDHYDEATKELISSLDAAGIETTPVVIHYDGELPPGMRCPFVSYTGLVCEGEPLFFNEVPVPAWCEIRQGSEPFGEILRDGVRIGRINYEANSFRQVESVDWLLPDGVPSHTDHYDRYGNHFATSFRADGTLLQTVYRGPGQWEIEVHHVAKTVTMRSPRGLATFATLTDFVLYALADWRITGTNALINSLSTPLFVMRRLAAGPHATLFWQEPMPGEIPGNMATELEDPVALTRIICSDDRVRRRILAQHLDSNVEVCYLSQLNTFADGPLRELARAFTLTNTDELPGIETLLSAFPQVTFVVAALTAMSDKLHALARRHPNLTLIPAATHSEIAAELEQAALYLDVNAGAEVLDVVAAAYHLNLLVLAHAPHAKHPDLSWMCRDLAELKESIAFAVADAETREDMLSELHRKRGPRSTAEDYARMLRT